MRSAHFVPPLLLALLCACASHRTGWAGRGSYWVLSESPTIQVRRGPQAIDPATGELVVAWVGARAVEGQPPLLGCELTVFDDRNGNRTADAGEHRAARESLVRTSKVLFGDVRGLPSAGSRLRARLVARTEVEEIEVTWAIDPD